MIRTLLLVLLPLCAGAACFVLKKDKHAKVLFTAVTLLLFGLSAWMFAETARLVKAGAVAENEVVLSLWHDMIGVDAIAALLLMLTCGVFFLASFHLDGFLKGEKLALSGAGHASLMSTPRFVACMLLFLGTMLLVLVSRNFGLLWVAIEATTLASAPLILYHRSTQSLEAMWKYLLICSVGIGFALFGTMCLSVSGNVFAGAGHETDLSFRSLAGGVSAGWFKAAFIFILAGYGTKMGLVPFHTWLPDAHSESPAIVSALLSGTLLNCAFVSIYRVLSLVAENEELRAFCSELLLFFGFFSLLVAALFIIRQTDFKRMLAYSSVEHMGLIALCCALSLQSALSMHIVGHTLLKSCLFLVAGNILFVYGSRNIAAAKQVYAKMPRNALLWLVGVLALCGAPPSPLFFSELKLFFAMIKTQSVGLGVLLAVLLFAVFAAMTHAVIRMLFSLPKSETAESESEAHSPMQTLVERNIFIPAALLGLALLLGCVFLFFFVKGGVAL